MSISPEELQSLVQRLNGRERKARRAFLICSILSFILASMAIGLMGWKFSLLNKELQDQNNKIQYLQHGIDLAKSENEQGFNTKEQHYEARIESWQEKFRNYKDAKEREIQALSKGLAASKQRNNALTTQSLNARRTPNPQDTKLDIQLRVPQ